MELTKDYQSVVYWRWQYSSKLWCDFYLEAKVDDYDIANNRTRIYTRLRSELTVGQMSGSKYQFTCSYAPTVEGNAVWYFGSETITETNSEQYVYHNDDGSAEITLSSYLYNGYLGLSQNISGTVTLPKIPRRAKFTAAGGFNDEENPSIYYENPAGNSVDSLMACISLTGATDDVAYRDITKTGTNYTFNLTDAERKVLRENTKGSTTRKVTFFIRTIIGTSTYYDTREVEFNVVNCSPTIDTYTCQDTNEKCTALTGNNQKYIRYISTPKMDMTYTLKKEAKIKSTKLTIGSNGVNGTTGTFTNFIDGSKAIFEVTDDRNLSASKEITLDVIEYLKLEVTKFQIERPEETSKEAILDAEGTFWQGNFSDDKANLLTVSWDYRESNSETWITGGTITPTIQNNKFYITDLTLSKDNETQLFDSEKEFKIKLNVSDLLIDLKPIETLNVGQDIIGIEKDKIYYKGIELLEYDVIEEWKSKRKFKYKNNNYLSSSSIVHNKIQLDEVLGKVLYENANGSNENITLNDNAKNYNFIEIFYKSNDNAYSSVKVANPNGKYVSLQAFWSVGNYCYGKVKQISINDNKINNLISQQVVMADGASLAISLSNFIYITKVIGYK